VCANLAGVRSVYFGYAPYNRQANFKALSHGHVPDFSLLDFRQLPNIVKVMDEDVKFIRDLNSTQFEEIFRAEGNYI